MLNMVDTTKRGEYLVRRIEESWYEVVPNSKIDVSMVGSEMLQKIYTFRCVFYYKGKFLSANIALDGYELERTLSYDIESALYDIKTLMANKVADAIKDAGFSDMEDDDESGQME